MNYTTKYLTDDAAALAALETLEPIKKICLDYETLGLDCRIAKPRLLQICSSSTELEERDVYVFDYFHLSPDVLEKLHRYVETRELLVGHNLYFDAQFLLAQGVDYKGRFLTP